LPQRKYRRNFASPFSPNPSAPQTPAMNSQPKTLTLSPSESITPMQAARTTTPHFPSQRIATNQLISIFAPNHFL